MYAPVSAVLCHGGRAVQSRPSPAVQKAIQVIYLFWRAMDSPRTARVGAAQHNLRQRFEENTTIRRPFKAGAPTKDGPRSNKDIRVPRVQLIDVDGSNRGDVSIGEALLAAEEAGLDLVEISPNAVPPVVKILDLGKLKYANQKKAAEARKHQKVIEIKEIKMRPNIDSHDYEVKMKAVRRFFEEGDKVKLTLRFRGREMAHLELGMQLLNRVREEVAPISKVEAEPKLEGRQMMMVLAPR